MTAKRWQDTRLGRRGIRVIVWKFWPPWLIGAVTGVIVTLAILGLTGAIK